MRASRETELAERFPSHVVCDWLGNSEDIARKHYYQTTDDHFARAVEPTTDAKQNPTQQLAEAAATNLGSAREINQNKAKQNPKRMVAVSAGRDSQPKSANPVFAEENDSLRYRALCKADGEGFEPPVDLRPLQFSRLPP